MRSEAPKPVRRIVTVDDDSGKSLAIHDGPASDVRTDPARPGFASTRIWVTDATPARIARARDPLGAAAQHRAAAARIGLPDRHHSAGRHVPGKVGANEVAAFFRAMGSPAASTYSAAAPHPYMQKTRTLDFCLILRRRDHAGARHRRGAACGR